MKPNHSIFIIIILALVMAACGPGQSQTNGSTAPAIVRIGWSGGPDSLNPGAAWLAKAYVIFELVYDSMYDFNLDGSFSLSLAESVERSSDGLTYTYIIKKGINWHDGQPFTAKDIAFTYNLVMQHDDFPTLHSYVESFESVEAPDDTTVVIKLIEPIPNIESKLIFLYVLPEHIWSQYSEGSAAVEFENTEMIGTGPFKMKEYKPNEFLSLEKNKDYFQTPAKIDGVIFQIFDNADVLVQAIKSGQVDAITEMPSTAAASLAKVENIKLVSGAPMSPGLSDIIFNQVAPENCPVEDGGICSGHPALRDRNVRLALAHATNKQKLIDVVMLGFATPGIALVPDGLGDWFNSEIVDYAFDVDKANEILDGAGYADTNGDGIREMPGDPTKPLVFRMNWPSSDSAGGRMAELLDEMWAQVGVDTLPQAVEDDALTAQCCPALDYDVLLWGWVSDPDPNLVLIIPCTDQIPTGYNETGYSNPRYDELYALQSVELDREKRKQMVWEMQKIIHDDVVYIIPYYDQAIQAFRTDRFTGWIIDQPKLMLEDVSSLMVIEPVK